jgi:hypothetical protein
LTRIETKADKILQLLLPTELAKSVAFYKHIGGQKIRIQGMEKISISSQIKLSIEPVDKFDNKAPVDGLPEWSVNDESLGVLKVDADGMGAMFTPAGKVGDLKINVEADADMGEGVKKIFGLAEIELTPAMATAIKVVAVPIEMTEEEPVPEEEAPVEEEPVEEAPVEEEKPVEPDLDPAS